MTTALSISTYLSIYLSTTGSEITGGYNGSSNQEKALGVTIGVDPNGVPLARTENHGGSRPYYNELCNPGQCGGVSKVPNLGNVTWAADKDGNNVRYRGYLLTNDGRQYKIADLMNPPQGGSPNVGGRHGGTGGPPIDFTTPGQNTYLRGRTNNAGNTPPSGILGNGTLVPQANVVNN